MKALAVFPAQRAVRLVAHPEPAITTPTGVKLRILEIGICGTDREIVGFQYGTPPPGSEYLVLGHESLGELLEGGGLGRRVVCPERLHEPGLVLEARGARVDGGLEPRVDQCH